MATIKEVAREAGVSVGTVSMVLNHADYGSAAIRAKVEAAVAKMHYVPSEIGRNLSLQRTQMVGIIVPTVAHPFFAELVEGLEESLFHLGYKTMLCCTQKKENAEHTFVTMLKRRTMDGIIMGAHSLDVSLYENLNRPVLAFDRYLSDNIPIVHCDHQLGGQLAAEAFLQHDCHHIVQIAGAQIVRTPAHGYHQACNEVMQAHGAQTDLVSLPWNEFSFAGALQLAREIFTRYPDVDGILGADMSIAACLQVAGERGIRVPEALRLVAYDGTFMTQTGSQPLTAVRQPIEELAELAAAKMVHMITGEQDTLPWVLPPHLLPGRTC
ncbi:MAG: LacI family DNA-binding transcriptional regulator [Selenomonas sp.]|nr:LacI family DNA-binding transcriptional regulator [Selenomonas sp.]